MSRTVRGRVTRAPQGRSGSPPVELPAASPTRHYIDIVPSTCRCEVPPRAALLGIPSELRLAATFLLLAACATPASDLWPVPPGDPAREIIVSLDAWHAVIGFPGTEQRGLRNERQESPSSSQSSALSPQSVLYEEWGYAERAWYVEGRQGVTGVLRALFWPSEGVVEVATNPRPWSARTPDPPAEEFRFTLSEAGYLRLRAVLAASRASDVPLRSAGGSTFYRAEPAYTLFHQCHQYAARALRAAGLPVSPMWALTRTLFAAQLRRARRMAD